MEPDAIIVLTAGTVKETDPVTGAVRYRSTTYEEGDAFGTLGGSARVQAAALLGKRYPRACLVTTGGPSSPGGPTHAAVAAAELEQWGIASDRIVRETESTNTRSQIERALALMHEQKRVVFVTNEYQVERVRAFVEHLPEPPLCAVAYQAAEEILSEAEPGFTEAFREIKEQPAYKHRVESEAAGATAIHAGTYTPAEETHKKERPL